MNKLYFLLTFLTFSFVSLFAQTEIVISDADLVAGGTYTWTNNNVYLLDGFVFLEAGGTLNIEAGTVIRGRFSPESGDDTSALIISQGARIFADGTAEAPIIFTAEDDDLSDPGDFSTDDRGEWGGLIILGRATIARPGGVDNVEGITVEDRTAFGGGDNPDDEDNSGRLNYVSIRHGGDALAPGNEINGLTLGGVGSGTEIDYIEVIANLDDGIEFFGGTVDVKHAVVAACGDDAYDYDFGYRGRGQFWFSYQEPTEDTGRAGEHDGASPDNQAPFSQPTIYNATYVGLGADVTDLPGGDANDFAILFRDNAGGYYNNSIFTDFPGRAIAIEDRDGVDTYARFQAGDLALNNNFFFGFGAGTVAADLFVGIDQDELLVSASSAVIAADMLTAGNLLINPGLINMDRSGPIDPRPAAGAAAASGAMVTADDFFETATYFGAFAPGQDNGNWMAGWTATVEYGLVDVTTGVNTQIANGFLLDAPVPNPANARTLVTFELPAAAHVTVTVADAAGRPLQTPLANAYLPAGPQQLEIATAGLPAGMYVVSLQTEGTRLLQKLVVTH